MFKHKDTKPDMMRITLLILIITAFLGSAKAQETLTGLVVNPKVKIASADYFNGNRQTTQRKILPFFDDFSNNEGVFPDQQHWTDNYVFINNDYAINPPTVGVATFDAIDNFGVLYSQASPFSFGADTLSSVEIRLDSLFLTNPRRISTSDSLYFSFFYQPQGYGNSPASADSLILEFLAPDEDFVVIIPADTVITGTDTLYLSADTTVYENWVRVWSSSGENLTTFLGNDSIWFRQVMIPVLDSARYYKPDFRFRFVNYASLSDATLPDWQSNGDQWNIDYVYLNVDRGADDIYHPDVAFASKAPNMLSRYTSMPYDQYRRNFINEMAESIELDIANLGSINYNVTYKYEVNDSEGDLIHIYDPGNFSIPPYSTSGYLDYPLFSNPTVDFLYPINDPEPAVFTTTHILSTPANLLRQSNDTVKHNQVFSNYYSYDDGTAEAGYGITPQGAQVAYQFKLNKSDSIFGVNMYFNQTLTQGNVNSFYLNVWNDNFGEPGELVYSRFGYVPVYTDSLNKFFYYELDSTIVIEAGRFPNLIFYVGWEQSNEKVLNMGYDKNNDASSYIFYRTFGGWNNSLYKGALMIRPVIGKEQILAMEENPLSEKILLYPNPTSGNSIRIKTSILSRDFHNFSVRISASDGRIVYMVPLTNDIDISSLSNGLYFVQIINNHRIVAAEKMIINK